MRRKTVIVVDGALRLRNYARNTRKRNEEFTEFCGIRLAFDMPQYAEEQGIKRSRTWVGDKQNELALTGAHPRENRFRHDFRIIQCKWTVGLIQVNFVLQNSFRV